MTIEEALSQNMISESTLGTIQVFPNPSNGHCQVKMPAVPGQRKILLYHSNGSLANLFMAGEEASEISLDLSDLDEGLYFLEIQVGGRSFVKKLLLGS
jgi:hypothetical protein